MIKFYSERKVGQLLESVFLIAVFVEIFLFMGYADGVFFLITFTSILTVVYCKYRCISFATREFERREKLQSKRLLLLRRLIDYSYTYKYDKDLFYKKFCEEINIDKLKKYNLINLGEIIKEQDLLEKPIKQKKIEKLSQDDYEFMCLLNEGFTSRELSVIFGLSHPQSIYVKRHRIRARLNGTSKVRQNKEETKDLINVDTNTVMDLNNVIS